MSDFPGYVPRLVQPRLENFLEELPAVLLIGPRAGGKTTTAGRHAVTTVRLDREAEATAFRADPDAALRGLAEPVLLDEWQMVPGVLGAVKRAVDSDPRPGRYIITGSVRADLQADTWPGTGRLVRLSLLGLTVREQRQATGRPFILDRLLEEGLDAALEPVSDPPDLRGYLELAMKSGFPEPALRLGPMARQAWLESYLEQLLTRDVDLVDGGRDPDRLRRFMTAYAAVTAQVVEDKTLWESAGINRKTAIAYEQLLKNLFVIDWLPAWSTNRLKQLARSPKRYVMDPALAAAALRLDVGGLMRRGGLIGPILESFVVAQLRAEATVSTFGPRFYHLRTQGGRHEVDVVIDLAPDKVVGIEIKATAAPGPDAAKHLRWLQDTLGDRFLAGIVLHSGPRSFTLSRDIIAIPMAALWC